MTRISYVIDKSEETSCCVRRNPNPSSYLRGQIQGIILLFAIYSTCYLVNYNVACLTTMVCIQLTGINVYLTLRALEQRRNDSLDVSRDSDDSGGSTDSGTDECDDLANQDEKDFKELSDLIRLETTVDEDSEFDDMPPLIPLNPSVGIDENKDFDGMPDLIPYMAVNELSLKQKNHGARFVRSMNYEQVMAYERNIQRLINETAERNALRAGLAEEMEIIREVNSLLKDNHYLYEYLKDYN